MPNYILWCFSKFFLRSLPSSFLSKALNSPTCITHPASFNSSLTTNPSLLNQTCPFSNQQMRDTNNPNIATVSNFSSISPWILNSVYYQCHESSHHAIDLQFVLLKIKYEYIIILFIIVD